METTLAALARRAFRSPAAYETVKRAYMATKVRVFSHDLTTLAKLYRSDKWGVHRYTPHYENHFRPFRWKKLRILEIGVGGYEDPKGGGASLRMWKRFFPRSRIYALDIHDKSAHEEDRITIFKGSQDDPDFLRFAVEQMGGLDIVIDDGSHVNEHVVTSFRTLMPLLAEGGIYAIEDTQTSYWPKFGGDSYDLDNKNTMMNFFKSLVDGLNYQEIARQNYEASYLDRNIVAVHFYHNLVFVKKGRNDEGSSYVGAHLY